MLCYVVLHLAKDLVYEVFGSLNSFDNAESVLEGVVVFEMAS